MHRILLGVALTGVLAGCGRLKESLASDADVVATAGDYTLTPERMAQILGTGRGIELSREAGSLIANAWVDYALFAQAYAKKQPLKDSATVRQTLWAEIADISAQRWHDTLVKRRGPVQAPNVDSVYNAGELRVLQHILIATPPNDTTPAKREAARGKAEQLLAQVQKGGDFGALARSNSQDPGSARDNGFLPPALKGTYVPVFEQAGWSLQPGAVSPVVQSQFGYHIIRRPTLAEVKDRLAPAAQQLSARKADSIYIADLLEKRGVKIDGGAAAAIRSALNDPDGADRGVKLATWNNGTLTVKDFLRWTRALPMQYTAQLKQQPDSMLPNFAKVIISNMLLVQQADSAKIGVTPQEFATVKTRVEAAVDSLAIDMGLAADASLTEAQRLDSARVKVDRYLDRLASGQQQGRPVPGALGMVLRERFTARVNGGALAEALELARARKARSDSAAAASPVAPAPGGPPVPGGAAPGTAGGGTK